MAPQITICVPAYKAEKYLAETLATVTRQTFSNWEMVVTEDGSKDSTEEIVKNFAAQVRQPVRYTRHEKNAGLPATRNTGFGYAQAPWIALLDSDDLWQPRHLETLLATAEKTGADLVHAGSILFDSDTGKELEKRAPSPQVVADFPHSLFIADYVIQPSSVMMSKSFWGRVGGFDPNFRYVEDREMWLRCARGKAKFAYTGEETCLYRKHATALSQHAGPMALANAEVFERNSDWSEIPRSLRRRKASEAWTAAGRIVLRDQPKQAGVYFSRALRHSRLSFRILAYRMAAFCYGLGKKTPA